MSILGLPSFETGTNLPVFNGLYPKPSRTELSNVDEAVVVSLTGDAHPEVAKQQPHEDDVPTILAAETNNVTQPTQENAPTTEVSSGAVDRAPLDPIVEAPVDEAHTAKSPVNESTRDFTPLESSHSALTPAPVISNPESLPAESPIVNDFVDHGSPGDESPASVRSEHSLTAETATGASETVPVPETAVAEQIQMDAAALEEATEPENEDQTADAGADLDPMEQQVTSPAHLQDIPAQPLPAIDEETLDSEEPVQESEHAESLANDEVAVLSGPAGLGPLEAIKEETAVSEEPAMGIHDDSTVDNTNLNGHKVMTNDTLHTGDLTPVDETPEFIEKAAASEGPVAAVREEPGTDTTELDDGEGTTSEALIASVVTPVKETSTGDAEEPAVASEEPSIVEDANARGGDAASDEQAPFEDVTPVDERREFTDLKPVAPPALDRKDSLPVEEPTPFETPFETPMERRSLATDGSTTPFETSFETPTERPFWAPPGGAVTRHEPEHLLEEQQEEEEEDEPPAEAPFIPRHSSSPEQDPVAGGVARPWETSREAGELRGPDELLPPSVRTSSVAESAADVEPLVTDEQLDVSDEFRPGVTMHSVESSH